MGRPDPHQPRTHPAHLSLLSSFTVTLISYETTATPKLLLALAILRNLGLFSTEYFFGCGNPAFLLTSSSSLKRLQIKKTVQKDFFSMAAYLWPMWLINAAWTYSYHRSDAYNRPNQHILFTLSAGTINEFITTLSLSGFVSWLGTFKIFSVIYGSDR